MVRNNYKAAYDALRKLRSTTLQASRDLYYIHKTLEVEMKMKEGKNLWKEMVTVPRNRRAAQSSFFVMFMQQVRAEILFNCVPNIRLLTASLSTTAVRRSQCGHVLLVPNFP